MMRVIGPRREIIGEFLHSDGELYDILECGHAVKGKFDSDGLPLSKRRMCMYCASHTYYNGHEILSFIEKFGFLLDSDMAIRTGSNIILYGKLPPHLDDINTKI